MCDSNMLFAIYLLLMCSLCHGILLENRKQCKIHFVVEYTIPSFEVLLCLNQSPESIYLLPLQLIKFCSDMMADKVQLFGQLTLLYHESILDSTCQHLGVIPAHRNTNKWNKSLINPKLFKVRVNYMSIWAAFCNTVGKCDTLMSSMSVFRSFSLKCGSFSRKSITSLR